MFQVRALLAAIALTVTVLPAQAASPPSCETIQKRAARLSMSQVRARMDVLKIPQEWRSYVENCLKDKK